MSSDDATKVFTDIYAKNEWKGVSRSGPGSTLTTTAPLRDALPGTFSDFGIRSLIDAPCGTAEWITTVTGGLASYLGVDIVPEIISKNKELIARENHSFMVANLAEEVLPAADAIFCRDCLVHLPLEMAAETIRNFRRSGSTFLISTTFPTVTQNSQARLGTWRPLNLTLPPFDMPPPLRLLRDRVPAKGDRYHDKSMGVWRL